jgi:glucan phosphoethanolaminetransferase (alkaline phosphatase superfamily)
MKKQKQIIQIVVILFILVLPMLLIAQDLSENNAFNDSTTPGADAAAIYLVLSLLIAISIGYLAKKLKHKKIVMSNYI